jgi:transcriptional antiterminator NusG
MASLSTSDWQWYALQILSNQEGKVKLYLERRLKAEGQECVQEVLVPMEKTVEVKGGKKLLRYKKLYPGYAFIRARLYDEGGQILQGPWQLIRRAQGVVGFVGGENPVPLKASEIERIQGQIRSSEEHPLPKTSFAVGDKVKIQSGPFVNSVGQIEAVDAEEGKLTISVLLFGRSTPVEAEFGQVGPVDE